MHKFFSAAPLWQANGLALIRMIVGFFMIYHGWELFSQEKMNGYLDWDLFKNSPAGKFMVYTGKAAELVAGILLLLGLFTRVAAFILVITMAYIAFFIGKGKVWYEDQHPFLFVLLGMVFIFCGPGSWSIDKLRLKRNNDN
jgi:putative oxidoreductase